MVLYLKKLFIFIFFGVFWRNGRCEIFIGFFYRNNSLISYEYLVSLNLPYKDLKQMRHKYDKNKKYHTAQQKKKDAALLVELPNQYPILNINIQSQP